MGMCTSEAVVYKCGGVQLYVSADIFSKWARCEHRQINHYCQFCLHMVAPKWQNENNPE